MPASSLLVRTRMPLPEAGHFAANRTDVFAEEDYRLGVIWIKEHGDLALHTHEFVELVLILDGSARHLTEHGSYPIAAGEVFVIKPGIPHGYEATERLELVNILFDPRRLPLPLDELSLLPGYHALFELEPTFREQHGFKSRLFLAPPMRRQVTNWAEQLQVELGSRQPGYRFMSLAWLMRIIGYLSRAYTGMTTPDSQTLLAINRVISHIEHHYASELALAELARMGRTCERTLQRYFHRAFGVSPIEYVHRLRVQKACELLLERDMTVTEVAGAVGVADSNYFARLFRQVTGVSPSEYRRAGRRLARPVHPLEVAA